MRLFLTLTFITTFLLGAFLSGAYLGAMSPEPLPIQVVRIDSQPVYTIERTLKNPSDPFSGKNLAGNYLASQFAQRHHDWGRAEQYLQGLLEQTPENTALLKRAMYLSMGAGKVEDAIKYANALQNIEGENALSELFMAIGAFKQKDYKRANALIQGIPEQALSKFVTELLKSWSLAALGQSHTNTLNTNTIHVHHAILIADYLKDYSQVEALLKKAQDARSPGAQDLERIADIYAHIGQPDKAIPIYEKVIEMEEIDPVAEKKIAALKNGEKPTYFDPITAPEKGIALTLYDMAHLLYQEFSDENARIFGHMAAYLDPDLTEAQLLLAEINARNERYDDAIDFYKSISPQSEQFLSAQRRAAGLLEDNGRTEEALEVLKNLAHKHNDIESLIQIGDLYRRKEEYKAALPYYNQAIEKLGPDIKAVPENHWRLLYVRGMSNERAGDWDQGERDLKAALELKPDHPFIMNYLGYSWADKGVNLEQSLELIQKAVSLRPSDGYITDSLGWVYYRLGEYEKAVPYLEKAVELLPYDGVINDHLGDAYWQVGRRLEAKFQWERARNNSTDQALIDTLKTKIAEGMNDPEILKASSEATEK